MWAAGFIVHNPQTWRNIYKVYATKRVSGFPNQKSYYFISLLSLLLHPTHKICNLGKPFEELLSNWNENPTLKLSIKDKLKVLTISEDFIDNIENYFEDISTLNSALDFDPIYENKEKNKHLNDLKLDIPQTCDKYLKIENDKNNLLQMNKNIVEDLNRKLLFLENRVDYAEKEGRKKRKDGMIKNL